jgi:hypothetical protein
MFVWYMAGLEVGCRLIDMAGLEKDPHLASFIYVKVLPDQAHLCWVRECRVLGRGGRRRVLIVDVGDFDG